MTSDISLLSNPFNKLLQSVYRQFFQPICIICAGSAAEFSSYNIDRWVCRECLNNDIFEHFAPCCCQCCGEPVAGDLGLLCVACHHSRFPFHTFRSAYLSNPYSKALLRGAKNLIRPQAFECLVHMMCSRMEFAGCWDLVVCVPSNRGNDLRRGWLHNQIMGNIVGEVSSTIYAQVLGRSRKGISTKRLSAAERYKNLGSSFFIKKEALSSLKGSKVLLVDDMATTGSSLLCCTKLLVEAGASSVDIVTIFRSSLCMKTMRENSRK